MANSSDSEKTKVILGSSKILQEVYLKTCHNQSAINIIIEEEWL
jgi:hypothetical protein